MWEGQKGLEFMKFMKDRTCKLLDRPGISDSFCLQGAFLSSSKLLRVFL